MNKNVKLAQLTKALILLAVVISTEMGSNLGIYVATFLWLELPMVVKLERWVVNKVTTLTRGMWSV